MERRNFFSGLFGSIVTSGLLTGEEQNFAFDQAIEDLTGKDLFKKNKAIQNLFVQQATGFKEKQLEKICELLSSQSFDGQIQGNLAMLLTNQKSNAVHTFFTKTFPKETNTIAKFSAIKYFIRAGFEDYITLFRFKVINASNQYEEFIGLTGFIVTDDFGKEAINLVLNDRLLYDNMKLNSLQLLKCMIEGYFTSMNLEKEYIASYMKLCIDKTKAIGES